MNETRIAWTYEVLDLRCDELDLNPSLIGHQLVNAGMVWVDELIQATHDQVRGILRGNEYHYQLLLQWLSEHGLSLEKSAQEVAKMRRTKVGWQAMAAGEP